MHLLTLASCYPLGDKVEETRFLKPEEEMGNSVGSGILTESKSIIPMALPSSKHSLVEKKVADMGEPEGAEKKILELLVMIPV